MTLEADEFIRRFLIHEVPSGFQRIRHYGYLANRAEKLALCRKLLIPAVAALLPEPSQCRTVLKALATRTVHCPKCKTGVMIRLGFVDAYRWPQRPPDTS
jgi:hypothetical protein